MLDFTRDDLEAIAAQLLDMRPGPVPRFRLLRDVLRLDATDPTYRHAQKALQIGQVHCDVQLLHAHFEGVRIGAVDAAHEEALRRGYRSIGLYNNLGYAKYRTGFYDEAARYLDEAVSMNPSRHVVYLNRAIVDEAKAHEHKDNNK